jgi:hypothetical protein
MTQPGPVAHSRSKCLSLKLTLSRAAAPSPPHRHSLLPLTSHTPCLLKLSSPLFTPPPPSSPLPPPRPPHPSSPPAPPLPQAETALLTAISYHEEAHGCCDRRSVDLWAQVAALRMRQHGKYSQAADDLHVRARVSP